MLEQQPNITKKVQTPAGEREFDLRAIYTNVAAMDLKPRTSYWILQSATGELSVHTPAEMLKIAESKDPKFEGGFLLWPFMTGAGWMG